MKLHIKTNNNTRMVRKLVVNNQKPITIAFTRPSQKSQRASQNELLKPYLKIYQSNTANNESRKENQ
jgi:hypothetical protein